MSYLTYEERIAIANQVVPTIQGIDNRDDTLLIIDRRYWMRGRMFDQPTALLTVNDGNGNVKLCCLGFDCLQAGLTIDDIYTRPSPVDVAYHEYRDAIPPRLRRLLTDIPGYDRLGNNSVTKLLMDVNDAQARAVDAVVGLNLVLPERPDRLIIEDDAMREAIITELFATLGVKVEFVN